MKKNHRKLAKFILAATATSTIASFGVGYLLTAFSLKNKGYLADKYWKKEPVDINTLTPGTPKYIIEKNYLSSMDRMKTWYDTALREDITITSRDGLKLAGHIFPAKQPTVKAKAKLPMTLGSIPLANSRKGRKAKI